MDFEELEAFENEAEDEDKGVGGISVKDLSPDQREAYNNVLYWISHPTEKPLTLGDH